MASSSSHDESECLEGRWTATSPLPYPMWDRERPELSFGDEEQYQRFSARVGCLLQHLIASQCYDTLSNFILFGQEYIRYREVKPDLLQFFQGYHPPLLSGRYTCVGLVASLTASLSLLYSDYPGLSDATYLVSCQDDIKNLEWYSSLRSPPLERCVKDHVLLCVKLQVEGRPGVLLLDPAFHVSHPITVMQDGLSPQSGAITSSTTREEVQRTFHYCSVPDNPAFVLWEVVEKRVGQPVKRCPCLIYVHKPYLSSVDIAERCNLVFPFKSLLKRDSNGQLTSGLYFRVRDGNQTTITFFHQVDGITRHVKHPLHSFLKGATQEEAVEEVIAAVATGTNRTMEDLRTSLVTLAHLLHDKDLLQQVLSLNDAIHDICR